MIDGDLEDIDEADLQRLIELAVEEGHRLEFKAEMPTDQDLRTDLAALANASGGTYVIGVVEEQSVAVAVGGVDVDPDDAIVRMEQVMRAKVTPRVPGLRFRAVPLASGRHVILIRVPRSWGRPHGVQSTSGASWRFVARAEKGIYDLDFEQIRAAFLGAADLPARLLAIHRDEVAKALAGDTPLPMMMDGPLVVMTITPLESAAGQATTVDLADRSARPQPPVTSSWSERWNLDGLAVVSGGYSGDEHTRGIVQLYRDGRIAVFDTRTLQGHRDGPYLPSVAWPVAMRDTLGHCLGWMDHVGVNAPVVVHITIANAKGLKISGRSLQMHWPSLTRGHVELPAVQFERLELPDDGAAGLGVIFDTLWQGFGYVAAPRERDLFGD